jgi:hypothetical protein
LSRKFNLLYLNTLYPSKGTRQQMGTKIAKAEFTNTKTEVRDRKKDLIFYILGFRFQKFFL